RHAARARAPRPRSARERGRANPRRRRQQRGPRLGRSLLLRPLLRAVLPPAAGPERPCVSAPADRVTDRRVLLALQGLALGPPLRAHDVPWLLWPACLLSFCLLAGTTQVPPSATAGPLLAGSARLEHAAGSGRATGADHVATWLGIVIPVALAYWVALGERVRRRLARAMEIGRGIGVRERRAWAAALIAHQRRLWAPLVAGGALALMILAALVHSADPGIAGLLLGVAVSAAGIAARGRWSHGAASPHRGSGVAALLVFLLVA